MNIRKTVNKLQSALSVEVVCGRMGEKEEWRMKNEVERIKKTL